MPTVYGTNYGLVNAVGRVMELNLFSLGKIREGD
jgi:hypothetical protein